MRLDILTLFPAMVRGPFGESIVQRAIDQGLVTIGIHNIRDYASGRHHAVDDYAYGGGPGMVMKPEPIAAALAAVAELSPERGPVVLLTPQGRLFVQSIAQDYSERARLTLICGRYEGVDERVRSLVDDELSLGDFVLSGGEPAAIAVADAVVRLVPGVLGSDESLMEESHAAGLLEYPQYTRPPSFRGQDVPAILLSGNHEEVARWRHLQSILRTSERRPDLLSQAQLTPAEAAWLEAQRQGGDPVADGGAGASRTEGS
ncbi:MAG TPA: tRNA (guanosine(37)-N1)-methyltransferase TrmD [Dehalococcoidia bacterium]|nr:tRNA (guanosine(37)-N1)-methyltransferase TrmD [Dehalococcoidia bacterium]